MKLKKAAAFALAAMLTAGTVCLTACGSNAEVTEATKQAILGDWVRTESIYGSEDTTAYCEVTLKADANDTQARAIEMALIEAEGVTNITFWSEPGDSAAYFSFYTAESPDRLLAQIEGMEGVESTFTDRYGQEEVYGEIYLTENITDTQLDAIKNALKKMDTVSEWNYYDMDEEIAFYKEAGWTDSEIRAMISRGEFYSYFDLTIPDAKDSDDVTAALKKLDGVEDVAMTAAYFRFNADGTVIVQDEYWYETTEEEYDSYAGILTGTYTVEGNTVRTRVEYEVRDVGEELVLQDGRLLQAYPDDGSAYYVDDGAKYYVDMTEVYEKM